MLDYAEIFGRDGELARGIPGFAPRVAQQVMADGVARALRDRVPLVVEAGTGIGKTYAYLVPALLSGQKVLISSGTRALQDQLYKRDLPLIASALGRPVDVALLKGRANYLCRHRLLLAQADTESSSRELAVVTQWAAITATGDISEVADVGERHPVWPLVTSTRENCLGAQCPEFSECHLVDARRVAQAADIVVVNHHLLLADLVLKEEGFAELLPSADAIIIDEAHQLPDTALAFFGSALSSRQLGAFVHDARAELIAATGSYREIEPYIDALDKATRDLRLAFGSSAGRVDWLDGDSEFETRLASLGAALHGIVEALQPLEDSSAGLGHCVRRGVELGQRFEAIESMHPEHGLRWIDLRERGLTLHFTPFDVAEALGDMFESPSCTWVLTSATLAVGEDFTHFLSRIGLHHARTMKLDSPFDYANRALLYLPQGLPLPSTPDYTERVIDAILPVLTASAGSAFLLFTSHRALRRASTYLKSQVGFDYPLLVQGEAPRDVLLHRFRALGDAVLLGTSSFWEGVDVRGEALALVVIDKLPFASPDDPLLRARLAAIENRGGNPFVEHQLPQAVIALKQGVGRLIRDFDDYGVAVLCDPRVRSRSYGAVFLESLPPMPRTRRIEDVVEFFGRHRDSSRASSSSGSLS